MVLLSGGRRVPLTDRATWVKFSTRRGTLRSMDRGKMDSWIGRED